LELFLIRQPLTKPFAFFHLRGVQRLICSAFWNWYQTEVIFNTGCHHA